MVIPLPGAYAFGKWTRFAQLPGGRYHTCMHVTEHVQQISTINQLSRSVPLHHITVISIKIQSKTNESL